MDRAHRPIALGGEINRASAKPGPILLNGYLMVTGLVVFAIVEQLHQFSLSALAVLAIICAFLVLAMTLRASPGVWSASFVYLTVFSLFHVGLLFAFFLGLRIPADIQAYMDQWFYTGHTTEAIILVILGLIGCNLGIHAAMLRKSRRNFAHSEDPEVGQSLAAIGFVLVIISIGCWFVMVLMSGGPARLIGSYEAFLSATQAMPLSIIYYTVGLGMVFLAAGKPSVLRRAGFTIFAVWSGMALPLGLRGEVLFPTLSALVVMDKRCTPITTKKTIILGLCLLVAIGAIRELRHLGIEGFSPSHVLVSPSDALAEMGSSLRPVSEVVFWKETGEDFIYGSSYLAPFTRGLHRLLPFNLYDQPAAEDDDRIMNVLIQRRVGPVGFSPVAEAYRNLGRTGVLVIMFLTGFVVGRIDSWPATSVHQAMAGVVLVPLMIQIRNDFVSVPFEILAGFLVLHLALFVSRFRKRASESHTFNRIPLRAHP